MCARLNAPFYVLSTRCQWNALPTDLPSKSTVCDYLDLWDWDGTLERTHHALYVAARKQAGREAPECYHRRRPKCQGRGKRRAPLDPSGYDAAK